MSRRGFALAVTVFGVIMLAVAGMLDIEGLFPWVIPAAVALVVGGLLTWRVPRNMVGWLIFIFSSGSAFVIAVLTIAAGISDPVRAGWLDAIGNTVSTASVMALPVALLRFPDGESLTRRWRVVEWIALSAAVTGAVASFLNGGWGGDVEQALGTAPFREATAQFGDVLSSTFYALMLVSMVMASVSLIVRFRRSQGEERLKIKWLAYSGGFLLISFVVVVASGDWQVSLASGWQSLLIASAFASIPAAIGIAILQYRLYDIDVVISRTVVLAVLAGFITLVYALVVVGVGQLIGGDSDGLVLPIVATAIVALAFEPVRLHAQRWANRLVYGRRASPYEVLSDLTQRLSHGEQGEGILGRMAARLGDGTGAERATIWLGSGDPMTIGATWPDNADPGRDVDLGAPYVFVVTHDGVTVGAFEVVKPRGTALSSAERSLIADLAGSAGAVLGYQRLNDSLQARAKELAESRVRLVEAQDTERRRLERDLHDGAQQHIVALKVKVGLARTMAAKNGAQDLEALLTGLADEAQAALDEVRVLAKGLYPPVLESDGLGAAISSLASSAPVEVLFSRDGIGRYHRDIEAAIYFDISEAVTNAVKHATGPIRVELQDTGDVLSFTVTDAGPGFDLVTADRGSGLQNLKDRIDAVGGEIEISSLPGATTTVRGSVPLQSATV